MNISFTSISAAMPKKIAIIGATSGIGRALAVEMHSRGYIVGATGRREQRLRKLQNQQGEDFFIQPMDVTQPGQAIRQLNQLIQQLDGLDIIVLNAGISASREASSREADLEVIAVNITGLANLAAHSFSYFEEKGHGQLVGVSSIASQFAWGKSASYNASKAFVNRYLQGYRQKANHSAAAISVTNLMPGYVQSEMTKHKKGLFWVASASKAARQMADAIESKKSRAYITRRWRLISWLIKLTPQWLWNRM